MAIKDFRWAMSLWCCQNNATFHELLETTNRWLLNMLGGKLFLEAAPIPTLPTSCLKPLIDGYWGFEMGNVIILKGGKNQLPANDKCWPAFIFLCREKHCGKAMRPVFRIHFPKQPYINGCCDNGPLCKNKVFGCARDTHSLLMSDDK